MFVIVYMHYISPVVSNELNYELWKETGQPLVNDMRTQTHSLNTQHAQVHMLYIHAKPLQRTQSDGMQRNKPHKDLKHGRQVKQETSNKKQVLSEKTRKEPTGTVN